MNAERFFAYYFGVGRKAGRCRDVRVLKAHPVDAIICLGHRCVFGGLKSGEDFWTTDSKGTWRLLVMSVNGWHTTLRQN